MTNKTHQQYWIIRIREASYCLLALSIYPLQSPINHAILVLYRETLRGESDEYGFRVQAIHG